MRRKQMLTLLFLFTFSLSTGHLVQAGERKVFRMQVIQDDQGFGIEAFRLLVPEKWVFKGGLSWDFQKYPPAASSSFSVTSPDGRSVMEQPPPVNFFWSPDQNLQYAHAQSGMTIQPLISGIDFLEHFYFQMFRQGVSDPVIIERTPLPELASQSQAVHMHHMQQFHQISPFQTPFQVHADAGKIKARYTSGGKAMIEEVIVTIDALITTTPSHYGPITSVYWSPTIRAFRAPAGEMDQRVGDFKVLHDSLKENPAWSLANIRFAATLTREHIRQQQAIFNRMQQIARSQGEISDMIMQSYEKRNQAYDRVFDNYSQAVRGVDAYVDPLTHRNVELPAGFDNAWTDGSTYVISDEAGFNPNIGSNRNWSRMEKNR
jgi:hypothetical protein